MWHCNVTRQAKWLDCTTSAVVDTFQSLHDCCLWMFVKQTACDDKLFGDEIFSVGWHTTYDGWGIVWFRGALDALLWTTVSDTVCTDFQQFTARSGGPLDRLVRRIKQTGLQARLLQLFWCVVLLNCVHVLTQGMSFFFWSAQGVQEAAL